ncbi:MAG: hypothetical protein LBQ88_06185, partial [Treponema sp.]|nr:hypothetical protein [Treponema sp.]
FNHGQHGQTRTKIKNFKQKVRIVRVVSGKFSSFSFLCVYPASQPNTVDKNDQEQYTYLKVQ